MENQIINVCLINFDTGFFNYLYFKSFNFFNRPKAVFLTH